MQTPEAAAAEAEYLARTHPSERSPHDPDYLACLDKGDIISRYQLLLSNRESDMRNQREMHYRQMRQLRKIVNHAAAWWDHCLQARRAGRKTVRLEHMEGA